jgi:plasmid stabilization system protein ParE
LKIEIYSRAKADIIRQFRYYLVEQDAPDVAFRFREAVRESIEQIKPHPRIGTVVRRSINGLRSWPVVGFEAIRIYYVETPGVLRVVRLLHGKRNIRRILKQEKAGA